MPGAHSRVLHSYCSRSITLWTLTKNNRWSDDIKMKVEFEICNGPAPSMSSPQRYKGKKPKVKVDTIQLPRSSSSIHCLGTTSQVIKGIPFWHPCLRTAPSWFSLQMKCQTHHSIAHKVLVLLPARANRFQGYLKQGIQFAKLSQWHQPGQVEQSSGSTRPSASQGGAPSPSCFAGGPQVWPSHEGQTWEGVQHLQQPPEGLESCWTFSNRNSRRSDPDWAEGSGEVAWQAEVGSARWLNCGSRCWESSLWICHPEDH